jgi:5'-phosphate synthase pdxT subunit
MRIGILSFQGNIEEHEASIAEAARALGERVEIVRVRRKESIDGLIIPGGESTVMRKFLAEEKMDIESIPLMGTCAGCVIMGDFMPIEVMRNGYGRQRDSFETMLEIEGIGEFRGVFIRAPRIKGAGCRVLSSLDNEPVFVEEGDRIALTFHPELTGDTRVHEYFLRKISR